MVNDNTIILFGNKHDKTMKTITELTDNQVFVFGSNANGNHAGGAARQAVELFGAIMGQAKGLQGQSYGIVTLDENMQKVSLDYIKEQLVELNDFAKENTDKEFLLTLIGCGIAGFEVEDIRDICMTIAWNNNVIIPEEFSVIHSFKGFNPDMSCRGFQYKEGETYTTDKAVRCECGFHACEHPLDVFEFYAPNKSVFHAVEQRGIISKDEIKTASTEITIKGKLSIADMVKAAIDFTFKRTKKDGASSATGDYGASSATGDYGASSATGNYGASSATGYKGASSATGYKGASSATGYYGASSATGNYGASSATGDYGASSATGNCGASSATGDYGASSATGNYGASSATGYKGASSATGNYGASSATGYKGASSATGYYGASSATGNYGASSATGDYGASSATGDYGASSATGNYGASSATGDYGASSATGDYGASSATGNCGASSATGDYGASSATGLNGIALAAGYECRAMGALGCWLCIAEREEWDGKTYPIKTVLSVKVDGKKVKPNVWYVVKDGKLKEWKDEE